MRTKRATLLPHRGKQCFSMAILADNLSEMSSKVGFKIQPTIYWVANGAQFPRIISNTFDAVVTTGSQLNLDKESIPLNPWYQNLFEFIRSVRHQRIPMLGICFGHQAIAAAFGVEVITNPIKPQTEIGFAPVTLTIEGRGSGLLSGLPRDHFDALFSHSYCITTVPHGAQTLAIGHGKMIHAFSLDLLYGVQFHPEISPDVIKHIAELRAEKLAKQGIKRVKTEIERRVDHTVLENFVKMAARMREL
ncbi:MAG: type 1 glutamine amidotransferase [Candidatus Micrarchaeota archaeon]